MYVFSIETSKTICRRNRATLESDPPAPVNREGETPLRLADSQRQASSPVLGTDRTPGFCLENSPMLKEG